MPYRRLPNTDIARITAMKKIIAMEGVKYNDQLVLSYNITQQVSSILNKFQKAERTYKQSYDAQSKMSRSFRIETQNARMYISHFIQVLNLAIQRGEFKKEIRAGYGLSPSDNSVPELSNEQSILDWGEKIIKGEEARTMKGGVPIYCPTIAKVKVYYNIFTDHLFNMRLHRENTTKALDEITQMRPEADDIILDAWNQIERAFCELPSDEKIEKCKTFGVVYYLRSNELARIKAEEMQNSLSFHDN